MGPKLVSRAPIGQSCWAVARRSAANRGETRSWGLLFNGICGSRTSPFKIATSFNSLGEATRVLKTREAHETQYGNHGS